MRGTQRAATGVALAFALGTAASCFDGDALLGAFCAREEHCGAELCCEGSHCRPRPDHCERGINSNRPYAWIYRPCSDDAECLVHGLPRCVVWADAPRGFCTDLCIDDDSSICERPDSAFAFTRTCVEVEDQSVCALDCTGNRLCPNEMVCRQDVCVPE